MCGRDQIREDGRPGPKRGARSGGEILQPLPRCLILRGEFRTAAGTTPLRGEKVVTIKREEGEAAAPAAVYPNPFNPEGTLTFSTSRPGRVMVRLFDIQGRLVRTLMDGASAPAGRHEVRIDGRDAQGVALASGVYFIFIHSFVDGSERKAVTILR